MRKTVSIIVNGTNYNIELELEFARYLEMQIEQDFNVDGNNDAKTFLYAYVRKNAELFKQEEEISKLFQMLDEREK